MNDVGVIEIGRQAFWVILVTGGPVLLVGLAVGLIIALFQTLTSIQEMTLVFVPKIVFIFVSLVLLLPFMINQVVAFGELIFDTIIALQ
jgi:flagellar biosynthetic protein FliQ